MDKFIINGGNKICGSVKIDRSKNSLLPIIAATVAVGGKCYLEEFPHYRDTEIMLDIIAEMGGSFSRIGGGVLIDTSDINTGVFPFRLFENIRASVFMLGAVISRMGRAEAVIPGGCKIGPRPIDIHLEGLKKMGVKIKENGDRFICECNRLKGARIDLPFPSVGATENLMIAASVAEGETVILNAAREPEVKDLASFITACGGRIYGAGGSTVRIEGVKKLKGCSFLPIADRIEAGTFALATLLLGGEAEIIGCGIENIFAIISKTQNSACKIYSFNDKIYIKGKGQPNSVGRITAEPYPGFPTDLHPQTVAMLSVADGVSEITDRVFPSRFGYAKELEKLGADIKVRGNKATVTGVKELRGAEVMAEDLRGGAGLVLACLKAQGVSVVSGVCHIDRGYDGFEKKLSLLGQRIARINA